MADAGRRNFSRNHSRARGAVMRPSGSSASESARQCQNDEAGRTRGGSHGV